MEKGSVALFAVSEVYAGQYAIVNHTRNVKGYISLREKDHSLRVGQLIVASVLAQGTGTYLKESSGNQNRKLQIQLKQMLRLKRSTQRKLKRSVMKVCTPI